MTKAQKTANSTRAEVIDTLTDALSLCAGDMLHVNERIRKSLDSNVPLIEQIAEYIIAAGGKRLRPALLILSARACQYSGTEHIPLAVIIEFIHTATLLHDDVVDDSELRRGQETAHAVWGNAASVLVGDFLYSRSFQLMVTLNSMRIMDILADTTNTISEGEVQQLLNMGNPEVTEAEYLKVIESKTAKLFEAACQLGAVIGQQPEPIERAMAQFGNHLGCAFQVADDVLDYEGDDHTLGKNVGDDLAEGKPTLPLILARERATASEREVLDAAVREGAVENMQRVTDILNSTDALAGARAFARSKADAALAALEALPPSAEREALAFLARHSVERKH